MTKKTLSEQLLEGTQHYNTKVRQLDENAGVRRIRMGVRESKRMLENILNVNHPTPIPASEDDAKIISECRDSLAEISEKLLNVRTTKRRK